MAAPNHWTDTLDQVLTLVVLLDDDMERAPAQVGLTAPRAHLLWQLLHHGPSTQRAIAEAMCMRSRNITGSSTGSWPPDLSYVSPLGRTAGQPSCRSPDTERRSRSASARTNGNSPGCSSVACPVSEVPRTTAGSQTRQFGS